MKRIYTAPNGSMVFILRDLLQTQGIDTVVHGEGLLGAAGEIAPVDAWVELLVVNEDDEVAARRLIGSFLDAENIPSNQHSWVCPHCKTEIEGQFGACWHCGAAKYS